MDGLPLTALPACASRPAKRSPTAVRSSPCAGFGWMRASHACLHRPRRKDAAQCSVRTDRRGCGRRMPTTDERGLWPEGFGHMRGVMASGIAIPPTLLPGDTHEIKGSAYMAAPALRQESAQSSSPQTCRKSGSRVPRPFPRSQPCSPPRGQSRRAEGKRSMAADAGRRRTKASAQPRPQLPACFQVTHRKILVCQGFRLMVSPAFSSSRHRVPAIPANPPRQGRTP